MIHGIHVVVGGLTFVPLPELRATLIPPGSYLAAL